VTGPAPGLKGREDMPYIAKHKIDAGEQVYEVGEKVPEEIVDEAMVEAGSAELLTDKQYEALAENDLHRKSNKKLREMCAEAGLEANLRMNKDELIALLEGDADGEDDGGE